MIGKIKKAISNVRYFFNLLGCTNYDGRRVGPLLAMDIAFGTKFWSIRREPARSPAGPEYPF